MEHSVNAAITQIPAEIRARAAQIRLLVLDVDGVLTDGRLYFGADGEALKAFHVRDGAGIVQLRKLGVAVAIISGRKSAAVDTRMRELGVSWVHQGVGDKRAVLQDLLQTLNISAAAVACVGDDTPDLPMFEIAHLSVAVQDAHPLVRAAAHFVTQLPGGLGAVREVCDLIAHQFAASRQS